MQTIKLIDLKPEHSSFYTDVVTGLSQTTKSLYPKYFYDEKGSQIFDQICELEEYYPTRTEVSILIENKQLIQQQLNLGTTLIEYGSGSSLKIRQLLDDSSKIDCYVPIDISKEHLIQSAEKIAHNYPKLDVIAVCADYTDNEFLNKIEIPAKNRVVFFPGSTLGNLELSEARQLLTTTSQLVGRGGKLILGFDLIKDSSILKKAYDDSLGVTAAFNKNVLVRMNSELGTDFEIDQFQHAAIFNESKNRVEMHLKSTEKQVVTLDNHAFKFEKDETIHTESSHKYELDSFEKFAHSAGFSVSKTFTDSKKYFAVLVLDSTV